MEGLKESPGYLVGSNVLHTSGNVKRPRDGPSGLLTQPTIRNSLSRGQDTKIEMKKREGGEERKLIERMNLDDGKRQQSQVGSRSTVTEESDRARGRSGGLIARPRL